MKILIGVCGIGNGHLSRQTNVIDFLNNCKHKIAVATTKNNIKYFKNKFKEIEVVEIDIPWIFCNENGVDFNQTLENYKLNSIDQFASFLNFASNVEKIFNGSPDLVITDYEPNVAQYSYSVNVPLICMEQQSKFLYLDEIKIKKFSILEERKRINYFFPKYDFKIISSFFPIKIKDKKVRVVSPIISQPRKKTDKKNHILVYFSPYDNSPDYIKIVKVLNILREHKTIVYTKEYFDQTQFTNIVFKNYSNEFKDDLEEAYCLISTAGHQILSETISIDIPTYLIPLNTYEQNYNATMIRIYNLGMTANVISVEEINQFIQNVPKYVKNITSFRKKYYKKNWQNELLKILDKFSH